MWVLRDGWFFGGATTSRRGFALLLLAMVGAVFVTDAAVAARGRPAKRGARHVVAPYDAPAVGSQGQGGGICSDQNNQDPFEGVGCVVFAARPTEFFIDVQVQDASGLPVPGWVQTETGMVRFCGSTARPVPVEPGTENFVWVFASSGTGPPCVGAATRGSVAATFSRRM